MNAMPIRTRFAALAGRTVFALAALSCFKVNICILKMYFPSSLCSVRLMHVDPLSPGTKTTVGCVGMAYLGNLPLISFVVPQPLRTLASTKKQIPLIISLRLKLVCGFIDFLAPLSDFANFFGVIRKMFPFGFFTAGLFRLGAGDGEVDEKGRNPSHYEP